MNLHLKICCKCDMINSFTTCRHIKSHQTVLYFLSSEIRFEKCNYVNLVYNKIEKENYSWGRLQNTAVIGRRKVKFNQSISSKLSSDINDLWHLHKILFSINFVEKNKQMYTYFDFAHFVLQSHCYLVGQWKQVPS